MNDQGIIWLASYPKSGNTWFRIFLTHILNPERTDLNLKHQTMIGTGASACFLMDRALGFDSKLLHEDELARLRPVIYNWHGQQAGVKYFKIHDVYRTEKNTGPIIPKETTIGIIYFMRNPLDVVSSLAHHMNCSIDEAITMMNCPTLTLRGSATKPLSQVRQICSSWSGHVSSWLDHCDIPLFIMRYEDMHYDSVSIFSQALAFLHISASEEMVINALKKSQFKKLKAEEQTYGFRESAGLERAFFRKGIVGDWMNTLTDKQVQCIIAHHGDMMRRCGYLDEQHQLIPVRKHEVHA